MSASFQNSTQRDITATPPGTPQSQVDLPACVDPLRIDHDLAMIDRMLGRQIDTFLHHPAFQALEAAWRGLQFLVDRTDFRGNVRVCIEVLDVSKETLRQDFEDAPELTQSGLYTIQKVYGHPNLATNTDKTLKPQPAVVVPTYRAQLMLFDASGGETGSFRKNINVPRDAWYYLGKNNLGLEWCRNIAFEPGDAKKNKYLMEQIHFPSRADKIIHGYFLLEDESQRGEDKRYLHAQRVSITNPYGAPIASRTDELFAMNVMFHIGGFYMARAAMLHAKWLGGSEGCFAFIPDEGIHATSEDAAKTTMEHAFFSNRTGLTLRRCSKNIGTAIQESTFLWKLNNAPRIHGTRLKI